MRRLVLIVGLLVLALAFALALAPACYWLCRLSVRASLEELLAA